jgi:hypothetical protein
MTTARNERQGNVVLASMTGLFALAEAGLAAIGLLVWNAQRGGHLTGTEAATFILLGASAAVGVVVLLLATIALARGPRGHEIARLTSGLAWLRVAGVILALSAIAIGLGISAIAGLFETFGAVVALLDAFAAVLVTGVAVRRTRRG